MIVTSAFKVYRSYPFYLDWKLLSNCICWPLGLITLNYLFWFRLFSPFCCFCRIPSICRTPKENAIRFQFSISERKQYHMFRDWVKFNLSKGRGYFLTIFISIYLWLIFCTSILNCMGVDRKTLFPASSIRLQILWIGKFINTYEFS